MKYSVLTAVLAVLLGASLSAHAEHKEAVSVKPWGVAALKQTLEEMPKGDIARGEKLQGDALCITCHGDKGIAESRNAPTLAGNNLHYLYKTLLDYQSGLRNEGNGKADAMWAITQPMTKQDMADLAAYYATQSAPARSATPPLTTASIERLVRHGDPSRLITPCASCHGAKGEGGVNETPSLAGQEAYYFERTMKAYKQGTRQADTNGAMQFFAHKLTDEEIKGLADYYAAIPNNKKAK
ncbi:MAG: c-type cytochrome [Thiotrichales bacterium]|jgi:cytochrome c553|nr:c-type cytochrome [Thiotrichales bacterium]